jgi:ZIP family zinc transporter
MMAWVIGLTSAAGVLGTGLGGAAACFARREAPKAAAGLLGFAGGAMLSVVCFVLIADAIRQEQGGVFLASAGMLLGCLAIYLLNDIIDQASSVGRRKAGLARSKPGRNGKASYELFRAGSVMAAAIALHNLPEGMAIGAACASDGAGQTVRISGSGFMLALVIGLHDVPEGMAVAVPLIAGGMKKGRAALCAALSGLPTAVGGAVGYLAGAMSPFALSLALTFAGGAMLYVVFGELLPEAVLLRRTRESALAVVAGMLLGIIIIYAGQSGGS